MQLKTLLEFNDILIQCHDDPDADAIASGFVLQKYLESQNKKTRLVYSGPRIIRKENLLKMIKLFEIGITHIEPSDLLKCPPELLITIDCQDGESNVTSLPRKELAAIDHHRAECGGKNEKDVLREVRSDYGACSTILWSMLKDVGFELNKTLSSALYYGLYMDTVEFKSLSSSHDQDRNMREEMEKGDLDRNGIEQLKRANLNAETLRILGRAILEIHLYPDYHFAVAQAQPCDPNILGVISDQIMEVDGVDLCVSYCLLPETERKPDAEFKFSLRSYLVGIQASDLAKYIANGLGGNAGGRGTAAGGVLSERELKRELASAAEIKWDGLSSALGRLIYRKMADYCENSNDLRKAYPEIAKKMDSDRYIQQLYNKAKQGIASAQNNLGMCYLVGDYVEQSDEQAEKWFRKAAEQGFAISQYNLGYIYRSKKKSSQAAIWYKKAAEQGLADAQVNLGLCYENGEGVEKDPVQAVQWYRRAAEQGNTIAQTFLGTYYYCSYGDSQQAAEWFRKAAEQGLANAQYWYGNCFFTGAGVIKDMTQGAAWYRKAAEQGFARAQLALGECLRNGDGVERDPEKAVEWFKKAAEQGLAEAQYDLGICYYNGNGVEPDPDDGLEWLSKAAEQGLVEAQQILAQLDGMDDTSDIQ